jgi:diguanylate cyclase (GGDEF)-like protein
VKREQSAALFEKRLRVLRQALAEQLPHRLRQIEEGWEQLDRQGWSEASRLFVQYKLQSLGGSSEILGFTDLASAARALQSLMEGSAGPGGIPAAEEREQLRDAFGRLRRACLESTVGPLASELLNVAALEPAARRRQSRKMLFFLGHNAALASELAFQVGCFGLLLRCFENADELRAVVDEAAPAALLIEAEPFGPRLKETEALAAELAERDEPVPVIVLGTRTDLEARIAVVQAGAADYLLRPPDVRRLIQKLDLLSRPPIADPYRVLVLERSYPTALEHSLAMQQAGMRVLLLEEPAALMHQMVEFDPDILLMDFAAGHVRGVDLAAVVRQDDAYLEVPIILLAKDRSLRRQLEALRSGADDFLAMPVDTHHLVSALTYHAQRSRSLRRFISRDGLTGCLNHSRLVDQLLIEVEEARRHGTPLTYAILDIDNLQSVNDRYGHLSGDTVLKSAVRLAEQRLRRADVIGRYGGDELGIILPATRGADAARVLDEIRTLFSELRHYSGDAQFTASFSCGAATFPELGDALALQRGAFDALARARRQGCNCVVLVEQVDARLV